MTSSATYGFICVSRYGLQICRALKEFKRARGSEERAPPMYHRNRISLNYKASSWDVIKTLYNTK
jgi:hypothetical protein